MLSYLVVTVGWLWLAPQLLFVLLVSPPGAHQQLMMAPQPSHLHLLLQTQLLLVYHV